jgi:glycosyltransferase involved in cell wall biosynthesis
MAPPFRLLFVGRMDQLKGGAVLCDALPLASNLLGREFELTFVGDGPERCNWAERAAVLQSREPRLRIKFTGWLETDDLERVICESDLLVVPSVWPEPFGLVGPEAGLYGLPVAAFAVGGIPEWLIDGVNGFLAVGDPPSPVGIAQAIVKCLRDPRLYAELRRGARAMAQRFSLSNHMNELMQLFESAVDRSKQPLDHGRSYSIS